MKETKIYVGLNDAIKLKQLFDDEKYISVLRYVCASYEVPFSFSLIHGGYYHENGSFTEENTLLITLNDVKDDKADEIAKDLCVFFHQESVLMTYGPRVRREIIREVVE